MSRSSLEYLIVPGLGDSGPQHWQSLWAARPQHRRVHQRDWWQPSRSEWVGELEAELQRRPGRTLLIAHSLGCITVAAWAQQHDTRRIAGALLVAPADSERVALLGGVPLAPLPFPSVVVASRNDPYCRFERAELFAAAWGSEFVDHGASGHINVDAGFGPWPRGEQLLEALVQRVEPAPAAPSRYRLGALPALAAVRA